MYITFNHFYRINYLFGLNLLSLTLTSLFFLVVFRVKTLYILLLNLGCFFVTHWVKMVISNVAKLLLLLFSFFQLSDQRRLLSNQPLQGRQRRSSSYFNDVTARPLSEEEFDLALYHCKSYTLNILF